MKSFIDFIKDVKRMSHRHPYEKGSRYCYWRNMIYMHSQPRYLWGRMIDKAIRVTDKVFINTPC